MKNIEKAILSKKIDNDTMEIIYPKTKTDYISYDEKNKISVKQKIDEINNNINEINSKYPIINNKLEEIKNRLNEATGYNEDDLIHLLEIVTKTLNNIKGYLKEGTNEKKYKENNNGVISYLLKDFPNLYYNIRLDTLKGLIAKDLEEYTIPEEITVLHSYMFKGFTKLKHITLHNKITSIEYSCFMDCYSLESITIPESVTFISNQVFANCTSLKEVIINSVSVSVDGDCFYNNCPELERVIVTPENNKIISVDGVLYNKQCTQILYYPEGKKDTEYSINFSLYSIESYCFTNNKYLEILNTNSVRYIRDNSIINCTNLKRINMSSDSQLETCWNSFSGCDNLEYFYFPKTLKSLPISINNFKKIREIEVHPQNNTYRILNAALVSGKTLIAYPPGLENTYFEIPSSIRILNGMAFKNCEYLKEIKLNNGITTIGSNTFENCTSLETINIPNSVTEIKECTSYSSYYGTQKLGYTETFKNCINLENVTLPNDFKINYLDLSASNKYSVETVSSWIDSLATFYHYGTRKKFIIGNENKEKLNDEYLEMIETKYWDVY